MGAITGTLAGNTEFAGDHKIITVTATIAAASDTITLTAANHAGIVSIVGILGATITGGLDAAFSYLQVSYSGLVVTVASFEQDGTAATDFTGTTVEIALLVKMTS
jgi:hypothetical protein